MMTQTSAQDTSRTALIQEFKSFYMLSSNTNLEKLDRLYTQDVEFRDPVHTVLGILGVKQYMRKLYANSTEIRFEYTDERLSKFAAAATFVLPIGFIFTKISTIWEQCSINICQS